MKKERQKAKKALQEANRRCQELLWAMEPEESYGQERKDSDEVKRVAQTLTCAEKVI